MIERTWKLDGQPISFQNLIRRARNDYGYGEGEEIFTTSGAAEVLMRNGHKVEMHEEENLPPPKESLQEK